MGFGSHPGLVNGVTIGEVEPMQNMPPWKVDQGWDSSIRGGLAREKDPGWEVVSIGRDVDGDVLRLDNSVIWGWEKGGEVSGVPQDGVVSVVDDVGFDPNGALPELR